MYINERTERIYVYIYIYICVCVCVCSKNFKQNRVCISMNEQSEYIYIYIGFKTLKQSRLGINAMNNRAIYTYIYVSNFSRVEHVTVHEHNYYMHIYVSNSKQNRIGINEQIEPKYAYIPFCNLVQKGKQNSFI
jgi:hypothetical protein